MISGWNAVNRPRKPPHPPTPSSSRQPASRAESPDFPELDTSQFGLKARKARELAERESDEQEFDVVVGPDPDNEQEDRTYGEDQGDSIDSDGPSDICGRKWPAEEILRKLWRLGQLGYIVRWDASTLLLKDLRHRDGKTFVKCDGKYWRVNKEEAAPPDAEGRPQVVVHWADCWRPLQDLHGSLELLQKFENAQSRDGAPPFFAALDRLNNPKKGVDYTQDIRDYVGGTNHSTTQGHRKDLLVAVIQRATVLRDSFVKTGKPLNVVREEKANAALLQSSGFEQVRPCTRCLEGRGPFKLCVVGGPFKGACGNCGHVGAGRMCEYHGNPDHVDRWQAVLEHRPAEHEALPEPAAVPSSSPVPPRSNEPADRSSVEAPDQEPETDPSSPPSEQPSPFTAFLERERAHDLGIDFVLPGRRPVPARESPRSPSRAAAVSADTPALNTLSPSRQNIRSLQSHEQAEKDSPESLPPDPLSIRDDNDYFTIIDDVCGSVFNDTSDIPAAASTSASGPSSTAAQKRKRSSTSTTSHSPLIQPKIADRHEKCSGGLEPCAYYRTFHPNLSMSETVSIPPGHTFAAGEASDAEVRLILSHASCDDIDFFLGVWKYWKQTRWAKRRGSEVPSRVGTPAASQEDMDVDVDVDMDEGGGYTMERYLSCATSEWLNEIVEGMQKASGPRGKEVAGKGAGSQADPVVLDD